MFLNIKKNLSRPRGTQDIFPPHSLFFFQVYEKVLKIMKQNNYLPVIFPTFEFEDLFKKTFSGSNISYEMYTFLDKKERRMALRPEGTVSVARLVLQNKLLNSVSNGFSAKFYYWSNMFRYERPQKNRYREFWQMGVELLGEGGVRADAQIIKLCFDLLIEVGVEKPVINLNYLGKKETQEKYQITIKELISSSDINGMSLCYLCQERYKKNFLLRILDCSICNNKWVFPPYHVVWTEEDNRYVETLNYLLDFFGITYLYDYRLVRGLDYYTGLVFEVLLEEKKAILGGGRYDKLYQEFGGVQVPGVGFALGIDRLVDYLKRTNKMLVSFPKVDVFFFNTCVSAYEQVLIWKRILEKFDLIVEFNLNLDLKYKEKSVIYELYNPQVLLMISEEMFFDGLVMLERKKQPLKIKKDYVIKEILTFFKL